MRTEDDTIVNLRAAGALTRNGLDLSVLEDGSSIRNDLFAITCLAVMWELARRYNTTYRIRTDGMFVFESEDAWRAEAKWFAQAIIRDWSGRELAFLGTIEAPTLPEAPEREGTNNKQHIGRLSWMNKEEAYNILLMVVYRIERGFLKDRADLDPCIDTRKCMRQSARNIELFKIGPTSFIDPYSRIEVQDIVIQGPEPRNEANVIFRRPKAPKENVIYRPESPERIPGYFDKLLVERFKRRDQARKYYWWKFLAESRDKSVDRAAIAEGLDPNKLYTHNTVVPEEMEALEEAWGVRVYTADDYKKPLAFLAFQHGTAEDDPGSDSSTSHDDPGVATPQNVMQKSAARIVAANLTPPSSTGINVSSPSQPPRARTDYSTPPFSVRTTPLSPPESPSKPHEGNSPTPSSPSQLQQVKQSAKGSLPPSSGLLQTPSQPPTKSTEAQTPLATGATPPKDEQTGDSPLPPAVPSQMPAQASLQPPSDSNEAQAPSPTGTIPSRDEQSGGSPPPSAGSSRTPAQLSSQLPSEPHEGQMSSLTGVTPFNAVHPPKDEEYGRGSPPPSASTSETPAQLSSQLPSKPNEGRTSSTGFTPSNALQPCQDKKSGRDYPLPSAGPSQTSSQRHLLKKASRRLLPQIGVGSYLKKKISNIERRLSRLSLKSGGEHLDNTRATESESERRSLLNG